MTSTGPYREPGMKEGSTIGDVFEEPKSFVTKAIAKVFCTKKGHKLRELSCCDTDRCICVVAKALGWEKRYFGRCMRCGTLVHVRSRFVEGGMDPPRRDGSAGVARLPPPRCGRPMRVLG